MSWLESHTCDSKYHPRGLRPEGLLGYIIHLGKQQALESRTDPTVSRDPLCLEELDFQNLVMTSEGSPNLVG